MDFIRKKYIIEIAVLFAIAGLAYFFDEKDENANLVYVISGLFGLVFAGIWYEISSFQKNLKEGLSFDIDFNSIEDADIKHSVAHFVKSLSAGEFKVKLFSRRMYDIIETRPLKVHASACYDDLKNITKWKDETFWLKKWFKHCSSELQKAKEASDKDIEFVRCFILKKTELMKKDTNSDEAIEIMQEHKDAGFTVQLIWYEDATASNPHSRENFTVFNDKEVLVTPTDEDSQIMYVSPSDKVVFYNKLVAWQKEKALGLDDALSEINMN